ncbi:ABC transporter permease EcsB [Staphylococcus sp. 11261D007BR]
MNTAKALFERRNKAHKKERHYYNRFIFNGHFAIFLMILLGAFILGYGQWLKDVPTGINYALIIAIVLSASSIFPLKTMLEEADQLFLLPFEVEMKEYIHKSIIKSYVSRLPLLIILLIIAYPLFNVLHPGATLSFIALVILALIFPILGLLLRWEWYLYDLETWSLNSVLFIIYLAGYYVILDTQSIIGLGSFIAIALLLIVFKVINSKAPFPWHTLIKQAQQQRANYYKFVNMFTDVKGMEVPAKRRKYLDFLLRTPKVFDEHQMYPYLFKRNFLRSTDAFNITCRLAIITMLLMIWLSHPLISLIIGSLAMYIIILQMSQFYTQEAYSLWPQVWPVSEVNVIEGYKSFLNLTVIILGILLSIVYLIININYFYLVIIFFIVGLLTVRTTIKKLKYQETLLKD